MIIEYLLLCSVCLWGFGRCQTVPLIVTTWGFGEDATNVAWGILEESGEALEAVERGISETCEITCCTSSVGACGRVDESGDISLDALIMDGPTHSVGAVGGIRNIRNPISVARAVMDHTTHTFLVGTQATEFAVEMGFTYEDLRTTESNATYEDWLENNCQPNSWENVVPDPTQNCGPYSPANGTTAQKSKKAKTKPPFRYLPVGPLGKDVERLIMSKRDGPPHADTVCQIIVDSDTNVVAGTSTNGFNHKITGRVGDTPITGAGAYVDNEVGAAVATGNGDVMMRFLPTYLTVELMRTGGLTPAEAAREAISRIVEYYPDFDGSVLAAAKDGTFGAACNPASRASFPFAVRTVGMEAAEIINVLCDESMMMKSAAPIASFSFILLNIILFAFVVVVK